MQKNRSIHSLILAAALIAAATLSSCTNEDNAVVENLSDNEVLFTATLAPRGEAQDDGATRAVDSSGKTKWKKNELIYVYYEKEDGGYGTAEAKIGTVAADGSAPFNVTLTKPKKGGEAKLVYPATLGYNGEVKVSKLVNQAGTLNDISKNYDAATATATLDVDNATFSSPITMKNEVCICKFSFIGLQPDDDENMYKVYIKVTEQGSTPLTYSIIPVTPVTSSYDGLPNTSEVYVAMLPTENADIEFEVQGYHTNGDPNVAGHDTNLYTKSVSGVKLVAGNFYTNASIAVVNDNTGNSTVTIPDGGTLYLNGANISVTEGPGILCKGDATIVLTGENTVTTAAAGQAGIQVGNSLIISGSGSLTAIGGRLGVGIGSVCAGTCGNITISDGTVTATGGHSGAGIGAGNGATCGDITINGGTVTATGGYGSAGIGSSVNGTCGNITIIGGTVTATGGLIASGIGSGHIGNCGDITISGTNTHIMATKGGGTEYCIGLSGISTCGTITIGGTVYYNGSSFLNNGAYYLSQNPFTWP